MAAQLGYEFKQERGYPGLVYAQHPHRIISRIVEAGGGAIPFGRVVSVGTVDPERTVVAGGALFETFLGISIRALDTEGGINTSVLQYEENETLAILRKGYMWVRPTTIVSLAGLVTYSQATGELGSGGAFVTEIKGARWETAAAASELALVSLQLTSGIIDLP